MNDNEVEPDYELAPDGPKYEYVKQFTREDLINAANEIPIDKRTPILNNYIHYLKNLKIGDVIQVQATLPYRVISFIVNRSINDNAAEFPPSFLSTYFKKVSKDNVSGVERSSLGGRRRSKRNKRKTRRHRKKRTMKRKHHSRRSKK
jgi:hypothetical protein